MACYELDYALERLRSAIDFAEMERDFVPLRIMANEVENSCREYREVETRLNQPAGRDVLMATLQSVDDGSLSPEEALLRIRYWLNSGQEPAVEAEVTQQYQLA